MIVRKSKDKITTIIELDKHLIKYGISSARYKPIKKTLPSKILDKVHLPLPVELINF